ncbi:MAG: helix-turn-helix transcriptional regulator [Telmatospirillum sp.]|nr:helix-turn-helix transcriptional regulator [Telmatospirillum sp.]
MPRSHHLSFDSVPGFPIEGTLTLISGKWKGVILFLLLTNDKLRFNELKRRLPGITHRMLTNQLRELEADGIVLREVHAEVPPRVEYSLSDMGVSLEPVITALKTWGALHFGKDRPQARLQKVS